jgi:arabinan endo-1,5-alpha-L-arabinosidase
MTAFFAVVRGLVDTARGRALALLLAVFLAPALPVFALDGMVQIRAPSAIVQCDGKFYCFGSGGNALVSNDGWTWRRGAAAVRIESAPEVFQVADRYCIYFTTNMGAPFRAAIRMIWGKTLDPDSPGYKWVDGGVVVSTDNLESAGDASLGVFRDPNDGRLWLTYGSRSGHIRLVELDPKTGSRLDTNAQPVNLAMNCDASALVYHDRWYYLFVNQGLCCAGVNSTYNIRVGRSQKITGPFLDNEGDDMLRGGGRLFAGSGGHVIGPGRFHLLDLGNGVQKFSCSYEADLDRGNAAVFDIRPLRWNNGWPVAGENVMAGAYVIENTSSGGVLEPELQDGQSSTNLPAGNIPVRMSGYLGEARQIWTVTPVAEAGGYPGSPWFKIIITGTGRTLSATRGGDLTVAPKFTGAPEQLWRFDQLTDGSWRIMPKALPDSKQSLALWAMNEYSVALAAFNPAADNQHWRLKKP